MYINNHVSYSSLIKYTCMFVIRNWKLYVSLAIVYTADDNQPRYVYIYCNILTLFTLFQVLEIANNHLFDLL